MTNSIKKNTEEHYGPTLRASMTNLQNQQKNKAIKQTNFIATTNVSVEMKSLLRKDMDEFEPAILEHFSPAPDQNQAQQIRDVKATFLNIVDEPAHLEAPPIPQTGQKVEQAAQEEQASISSYFSCLECCLFCCKNKNFEYATQASLKINALFIENSKTNIKNIEPCIDIEKHDKILDEVRKKTNIKWLQTPYKKKVILNYVQVLFNKCIDESLSSEDVKRIIENPSLEHKKLVGNCQELSFVVWYYLTQVLKLPYKEVDIISLVDGDHEFVAIGNLKNDENGLYQNFIEWDENIVICDLWAGIVCKARDYPEQWIEKLKYWESEGITLYNVEAKGAETNKFVKPINFAERASKCAKLGMVSP